MPGKDQIAAALTARTYSYRELVAVSGATRKEVSDWVARGIITAEPSPGSGKHRQYSWQSLIEAVAAKGMSRHVKASTIEEAFGQMRGLMEAYEFSWGDLINHEKYPDGVAFNVLFPDDESGLVVFFVGLPEVEGAELGTVDGNVQQGESRRLRMLKTVYTLKIDLATVAANAATKAANLVN